MLLDFRKRQIREDRDTQDAIRQRGAIFLFSPANNFGHAVQIDLEAL
jgi:hypothetical protein